MKYLEKLEDIRIQILLIFVLMLFSLWKTVWVEYRKFIFKQQQTYTEGEIVNHEVSGIYENFYITYQYKVDHKVYENTVNYRSKFRNCYISGNCMGKKFIVYYNEENPNEAYIDFNEEK